MAIVKLTTQGLARRSIGPAGLWVLGVSASAPMTVLAGGVTSTFATTGVVAVPLSFLLLGGVLGVAAVGPAAMVRDTPPHAATFTALLAHGLGREVGVAGAAVALVSYNAIQIGLYGLLGATLSALLGGPWWAWAGAAWVLLAVAGVARLHANTRVIAVVLAGEIAVIAAVVLAAVLAPVQPGAGWEPVSWENLFTHGTGTVFALGVAAFVGFESVTAFGEETRDRRSVARAMTAVLVFLSLLYTAASWALAVAVGPALVADAARDQGAQLPVTVLLDAAGPVAAGAGVVMVVLSVLGAMAAFHHVVARYLYALGREGVLPARLGGVRGRGGVPVTASLVQSGTALAVLVGATTAGVDPVAMFVTLSTLAALGVVSLVIGACAATFGHYRQPRLTGGPLPSRWQRQHAPLLGGAALLGVLAVTLTQLSATTGDSSGAFQWLLPAVLVVTAVGGGARAAWLRRHRPAAWTAIGRGQPRPLAVLDRDLSDLAL